MFKPKYRATEVANHLIEGLKGGALAWPSNPEPDEAGVGVVPGFSHVGNFLRHLSYVLVGFALGRSVELGIVQQGENILLYELASVFVAIVGVLLALHMIGGIRIHFEIRPRRKNKN